MSTVLGELKKKGDPERAKNLAWFFKTGKGEYAEGDLFLGITVPESRKIAQKYSNISFSELEKLLKSKYHEVRLTALLILVHKFKTASKSSARQGFAEKVSSAKASADRRKIYNFYLKNTKYINNWDLVDLSAHYIVGDYLCKHPFVSTKSRNTSPWQGEKKILEKMARSKNMWERRIAIISTFAFIYKGESEWTFKIVKMLLNDKHDLIHKACGWMLREVGKRVSEAQLEAFLDVYGPKMPRTMLRYAIERLPEPKRLYFLKR